MLTTTSPAELGELAARQDRTIAHEVSAEYETERRWLQRAGLSESDAREELLRRARVGLDFCTQLPIREVRVASIALSIAKQRRQQ